MSDLNFNQPPFRMPCEGVAAKPLLFFGAPFQHNLKPVLVDKYTNSTTVPNWNTHPGQPPTISPYERWHDNSADGGCELNHCVEPGSDSAPPCAAWTYPYTTNAFIHASGEQVNFAVTHKRGFKNVQARRLWQGCFGWDAPEAGCLTNLCADGVTGYRAYQPNPSSTKWRTVTYDSTVNNHFDAGEDVGGYLHASKSGARTVNATSGEVTSSLSTFEEDASNFGSGPVITKHVSNGAGYFADESGTHTSDFNSGGSTLLDTLDEDLHCAYPHFRTDASYDLPGFIAAWNGAGTHATNMPLMTDPNSYSCSTLSVDTDGNTWTVNATFNRDTTTASWHFTITQNNGTDENNTWEYYGSVTLSDANASADVYADICSNLLVLWPLNDDSLYPWRTDLKVSVAPLVSRNEYGPSSPLGFNANQIPDLRSPVNDASGNTPFSSGWTPTYTLMNWIDPNVWLFTFADGSQAAAGTSTSTSTATGLIQRYDGSILGAPKPAGYQNYFNFGFPDIVGCCYTDPSTSAKSFSWYQLGWGMDVSTFNGSAGSQLPLNATQWNTFLEAVNKPIGAWIFYADKGAGYVPPDCPGSSTAGDAGYLVACKYAEILEIWNSENFARPAGDDKFLIDENRVYCATNISGSGAGSTWSLIDPTLGIPPADGADFSGIWGGPVTGGFYNVSSYSGGMLTLGAKVYDLPSNWASKSEVVSGDGTHDSDFCFGQLRFPDCPALLGAVAITPDVAGTTMTFGTSQPAFGMNTTTQQEQVDLYDANMNPLASNMTATRINDSSFSIPTSNSAARFVQIHGAAAWYMNDTSPKGDYTVLEFTSDYRNPGEAGRADCSGNPITYPAAITYTDADGLGHSATVTFPGNGYSKFVQNSGCLPFVPCAPKVVCISPNGETFPNGQTFAFPASFTCDEEYGSKWWGVVQSTMTDLFWQRPHRPCNIKPCAQWKDDGAACHDNVLWDGSTYACAGDPDYSSDSLPPIYYYATAPQVEARIALPNNYGTGQDEAPPALPIGIQLGWLSPVTNTTGDVAFPPNPPGALSDRGEPAGTSTTWDLHETFCGEMIAECRFSYKAPGC